MDTVERIVRQTGSKYFQTAFQIFTRKNPMNELGMSILFDFVKEEVDKVDELFQE